MDDLKPEGIIKGSFTISLEIAGRRVQIGGYIQDGDSKEALIAKMDEAQDCIDHQLIRADLKSQEGQLKGEMIQLENLLDDHEKLIAKKGDLKVGKKLHPQDEAKLRNFEPSADHLKASIAYRRRIIAENRKSLGLGPNGA